MSNAQGDKRLPAKEPLIRLHTLLWWFFIGWFAVVTLMLAFGFPYATKISMVGLVVIVIATIGRLVQLGVLCNRAGNKRLFGLSALLMLLLLATGLLRLLIG